MDPDPAPAIFGIVLQDGNKKRFSADYFLKVHHFSKDKKSKKSCKAVGIKVFLTIFAW
jgi:hypothetical protein